MCIGVCTCVRHTHSLWLPLLRTFNLLLEWGQPLMAQRRDKKEGGDT